jgi:lantibiotic modifying enzyme
MEVLIQNGLADMQPLFTTNNTTDDSLFGGNLGLVLLYYEWHRLSGKKEYYEAAGKLLTAIIDRLNNDGPGLAGPSLSRGGAGLAFVIMLLDNSGLITGKEEDTLAVLDKYLFEAASYQLDHDFTDCLHGAFGIMHYFTRHRPGSTGNKYLNRLVRKACGIAVKEPSGYWFRNYMVREKKMDDINFSLSHGLSGMLLVMLAAYEHTKYKSVVKKGIQFIRKHQLYVDTLNGEYSFYPFSVKENGTEIENRPRMAWCYGDLNQVLLFYRAGKLFGDAQLLKLADIIGLYSLMRKDEASTMITDSHFCHGAAGLAQFYRCLYNESQNEKYREGYQYWIGKTIEFLHKDIAKGNFQSKEHSLLEGPVGVSLVLLTYLSAKEPEWSRVLFL